MLILFRNKDVAGQMNSDEMANIFYSLLLFLRITNMNSEQCFGTTVAQIELTNDETYVIVLCIT